MRESEPIQVEIRSLMNRVQEGKSPEEMMTEFNIPSRSALKIALMQVMQQTGEDVVVPGLIGRASIHPRYTSSGNRVDPAMLEGTGEEEAMGDFDVTIDQGVISFRPSNKE